MKNYSLFTFLIVALLAATSSCKKDDVTVNFHEDYFGFTKGRYVVYDVMEVHHSTGILAHDTTRYQLKTIIGDTVIDNEGRVAREFFRYKRMNPSDPWVVNDLWTAIITDFRAEVVEENQRVIKLVFAPTKSKSWGANSFNTLPELPCRYEELHKPYFWKGIDYDSTLVVEHEDDSNLVQHKRKFEVYAKGKGLIREYFKDLEINNFDTTDINQGTEMFKDAIEFGFQ